MELTGKVIKVLPLQSGQGKNGTWKKQEYVIETEGQYPKKICFSLWGERIDNANIKEGEQITISFDVESREYEGKWYTQVTAWKVVKASDQKPDDAEIPESDQLSNEPEEPGDNLPF
jgi:hypothetical protein